MRIADAELRNLVNGATSGSAVTGCKPPPWGIWCSAGAARRKKTNPCPFCRVAERETEHDEGGRKRYGWTGAHFRITRLRKMSASNPAMARIANYLRENSSVKDYRMTGRWCWWIVSSEAHAGWMSCAHMVASPKHREREWVSIKRTWLRKSGCVL